MDRVNRLTFLFEVFIHLNLTFVSVAQIVNGSVSGTALVF